MVRFLITGHSLRQSKDDGSVSYYHPKVEAGIESALVRESNRLVVRETLKSISSVLASDERQNSVWATEAAAKLVAIARKIDELAFYPDGETQTMIDNWLTHHQPEDEWGFQKHLQLAADCGSPEHAITEVGRYLTDWTRETLKSAFSSTSRIPERSAQWFERWSEDSHVRTTVKRYVEEVLPSDHTCEFNPAFIENIQRLVPDISNSFIKAATLVVERGFYLPANVISIGAVQDINGFEQVVDQAITKITSEEGSEERRTTHLSILNGEFNEDYGQFLAESSDEGFTADQFLEMFVKRARELGDWDRLAQHRHRDQLTHYWLKELLRDELDQVDPAEVLAAFDTGLRFEPEKAWSIATLSWDVKFLHPLEQSISRDDMQRDARRAVLGCLVMHAPDLLKRLIERLRQDRKFDRLVEIAYDIAERMKQESRYNSEPTDAAVRHVKNLLPDDMAGVVDACSDLHQQIKPQISEEAQALLQQASAGNVDVRLLRVLLDQYVLLDVEEDIHWLLVNAENPSTAVEALKAAVRLNMWDVVWSKLDHQFADVVAASLHALGALSEAPLDEQLLCLAKSPSSTIRKALVTVLEAKPHRAHLPTLLSLLSDGWSQFSDSYGSNDSFPIARQAMKTIAGVSPLKHDEMQKVYEVVVSTSDFKLCDAGLRIIASAADKQYPEFLLRKALTPGRLRLRQAMVHALCNESQNVNSEVLTLVTVHELLTQPPTIAAPLACLIGLCAPPETLMQRGRSIVKNADRRVLILLLSRFVTPRAPDVGRKLGALINETHPAVIYATTRPANAVLDPSALDDLGPLEVCDEVYKYLVMNHE